MSPKTDRNCVYTNDKAMLPTQVKDILVSITSAHAKFPPSRAYLYFVFSSIIDVSRYKLILWLIRIAEKRTWNRLGLNCHYLIDQFSVLRCWELWNCIFLKYHGRHQRSWTPPYKLTTYITHFVPGWKQLFESENPLFFSIDRSQITGNKKKSLSNDS